MVDEPTHDDEEDWMKYANSGFGSTDYSLWDDAESDVQEEHLEEPEQLEEHTEEIPRAPSPAGLKHLFEWEHAILFRTSRRKRSFQQTMKFGPDS